MLTPLPSTLAGLLAASSANTAARGAAATRDNAFSRQLEQVREARNPEPARAPLADKRAPPPAAAKPAVAPSPAAAPHAAPPHAAPEKAAPQKPARPAASNAETAARSARANRPATREAQRTPSADADKAEAGAAPAAPADTAKTDAATAAEALPAPTATAEARPADSTLAALGGLPTPLVAASPSTALSTVDVGDASEGGTPHDLPGANGLAPQAALADARDARAARTLALPDPNTATWQQAQAAALLTNNPQERDSRTEAAGTSGSETGLAPAGLAGLGNPAAHALKGGETTVTTLATPATSANAGEFRAALGTQVSFFARNGVQQAELHLNPADMGPVSIQIVLDGQQAQVNFGADSALTRQIIESGMPELASALRDAGLTLTGGGVSQHTGGQRSPQEGGSPGTGQPVAGAPSSGDGATDTAAAGTLHSFARIAAGGVDLYA